MVSGMSAGGLATYLHVDEIASWFPRARYTFILHFLYELCSFEDAIVLLTVHGEHSRDDFPRSLHQLLNLWIDLGCLSSNIILPSMLLFLLSVDDPFFFRVFGVPDSGFIGDMPDVNVLDHSCIFSRVYSIEGTSLSISTFVFLLFRATLFTFVVLT